VLEHGDLLRLVAVARLLVDLGIGLVWCRLAQAQALFARGDGLGLRCLLE